MNRPLKLGILGSTRGTDMLAIIDALNSNRLHTAAIATVISNKPDSGILQKARAAGIEASFCNPKDKTREEYDREVMDILAKKKVDLVLLIGYMRILSPVFVQAWPNKIMNVHPSLLPAFPGGMDTDVHAAVLKSGAKETGCTIHFVDESVDGGPIIVQKRCPVDASDTPETLKAKVQQLEGEAFIEAIHIFQEGTIQHDL